MRRDARPVALAVTLALGAACAGAPPRPPAPAAETPSRAPPPVRPAPPSPIPEDAPRYGPEPAVAPTRLESRAAAAARERFPKARPSGALALAARELARRAAEGDPLLARDRLRGALARGLSYDAAPSAYAVSGGVDGAPAALARALPDRGQATHLGVGAYQDGERAWVVLLTADRKARLAPFPRELPAGGVAVLSGTLESPLLHPRVFVTRPGGEVREAEVTGSRAFQARVEFPVPGRYLVEVVAQSGPGGPEVAALLTVSAGGAPLERAAPAARAAAPEPTDLRAAEARIVDAINALRRERGLRPLVASPAVAAVAREHSAGMLAARTLAHVLPGSGDLGDRLRRARIPYVRALENVALGGSATAAHEAAEESPAHLGNMLAPGATQVGVGLARGTSPGGAPVFYLTEVFVEPADAAGAGSTLTPDTRVREVLWAERARAGQPPLTADVRLDALAREAAARMRREEAPAAGDLGERALDLGRRVSGVDVFVGSDPSVAARSASVRDPRYRRVGVGVTVGDTDRFGAGRMWIAVVFTD